MFYLDHLSSSLCTNLFRIGLVVVVSVLLQYYHHPLFLDDYNSLPTIDITAYMIKGVEYKPLQICNFNIHDATLAWIELAMCITLCN